MDLHRAIDRAFYWVAGVAWVFALLILWRQPIDRPLFRPRILIGANIRERLGENFGQVAAASASKADVLVIDSSQLCVDTKELTDTLRGLSIAFSSASIRTFIGPPDSIDAESALATPTDPKRVKCDSADHVIKGLLDSPSVTTFLASVSANTVQEDWKKRAPRVLFGIEPNSDQARFLVVPKDASKTIVCNDTLDRYYSADLAQRVRETIKKPRDPDPDKAQTSDPLECDSLDAQRSDQSDCRLVLIGTESWFSTRGIKYARRFPCQTLSLSESLSSERVLSQLRKEHPDAQVRAVRVSTAGEPFEEVVSDFLQWASTRSRPWEPAQYRFDQEPGHDGHH